MSELESMQEIIRLLKNLSFAFGFFAGLATVWAIYDIFRGK